MKRTTIYLPDDLNARLAAEAKRRGVTEAEVIRGAVDKELLRTALGAGIITGSGGGRNGADLTRETRHLWLEGFGDS